MHLVSASRGPDGGPRPAAGDPTPHWYYLCGVDVDADGAAVAVLGDSITDGRGSPTDGNGRWTDHLARRLNEGELAVRVGVLNHGLGGNRVLKDGLGPNALARLDRDVLAQPGVRWLIVLEGINDLGTRSATARDLIVAYEQIVLRAHARDIKVYGATLMPCEGSPTSPRDSRPHAKRSTSGSASRVASTRSSISTWRPATHEDPRGSRPPRTAATTSTRAPKGTPSWPRRSI